ncbi:MAG: adenosylcobinamide-GDP ribazoletransferase [Kiloniellales bacterium]|nr:adenosylcobinamide-GDP ribazoletransferase [Kiloniellales bacterium]
MTAFLASLSSCPRDFWLAVGFLTRLRGPWAPASESGALGPALRLAPLVGLVVGVAGALVAWLCLGGLGLPPWPAALLTVGATVWITGALHEDGLADVADGFGGAFERGRKLAIMRDSRIGAYGVLALILSIGLRGAALAALAGPEAAAAVLIAAHSLSRGLLAPVMLVLAPARDDGLAAAAGRPGPTDALTTVLLGLILAALAVGGGLALSLGLAALAAAVATAVIAARQIGGYTGDVLGAVQQTAEIAVLLTAAALLT